MEGVRSDQALDRTNGFSQAGRDVSIVSAVGECNHKPPSANEPPSSASGMAPSGQGQPNVISGPSTPTVVGDKVRDIQRGVRRVDSTMKRQ